MYSKEYRNEKIRRVLYWGTVVLLFFFTALAIFAAPVSDVLRGVIGYILFHISLFVLYLGDYKKHKRFRVKKIGSDIIEYSFDNQEKLLKIIEQNCFNKGYIYKSELNTNLDESFILYSNDESPFPKEKICVYLSDYYECEDQSDKQPSLMHPAIVPGQGRFHFEYRVFLNKICGELGRDYNDPKDWVDIETTLIVIVDDWNGMLNWVVNGNGHLPFVLVGLIVKNNPNKLYIAKDNRKNKRNDYSKKIEELMDILEVRNRIPIGTLRYDDIDEKFDIKSYEDMQEIIEERNKKGRYYI